MTLRERIQGLNEEELNDLICLAETTRDIMQGQRIAAATHKLFAALQEFNSVANGRGMFWIENPKNRDEDIVIHIKDIDLFNIGW